MGACGSGCPTDPGDYLKYAPCEQTGVGVVTDDTCMAMATLAGLCVARRDRADPVHYVHQAYLRWGRKQAWAKGDYDAMIDGGIDFPSWFYRFCFSSGAGKNTLAALNGGKFGTLDDPVRISTKDGSSTMLSEGCGGVMRVAPVGWFAAMGLADDAYVLGKRTAAITHGGTVAQSASGAVAVAIECLCLGWTWEDTVAKMTASIVEWEGEGSDVLAYVVKACRIARERRRHLVPPPGLDAGEGKGGFDAFSIVSEAPANVLTDGSSDGAKPDLFTAASVLVQVMVVCEAAQTWSGTPSERMAWARTLAVTQDGDSDSVAAVVGNVLGAQFGAVALGMEGQDHPLTKLQSMPFLRKAFYDVKALGLWHIRTD